MASVSATDRQVRSAATTSSEDFEPRGGRAKAELIEPGREGYVLDDDFSPAFAALADPAALERMGAAARARAERLTWDAHVDAVLALYARVAEARA